MTSLKRTDPSKSNLVELEKEEQNGQTTIKREEVHQNKIQKHKWRKISPERWKSRDNPDCRYQSYFSHREATEQGCDHEFNQEKQKQHLLVPVLQSKFKRPNPVQPKEKQWVRSWQSSDWTKPVPLCKRQSKQLALPIKTWPRHCQKSQLRKRKIDRM